MTDWRGRQVRGVIDFRLETDESPMTLTRLDQRIAEYYQQLRVARVAESGKPPPDDLPFDDPIDF